MKVLVNEQVKKLAGLPKEVKNMAGCVVEATKRNLNDEVIYTGKMQDGSNFWLHQSWVEEVKEEPKPAPVIANVTCPVTHALCGTAAPKKLPSIEDMKSKLLKLQYDEYWKYGYDKAGNHVRVNKWSFRSTARTMLRRRIETAKTVEDILSIISDVYGPTAESHRFAPLTIEEWVAANF